jgi:hypothetical protein
MNSSIEPGVHELTVSTFGYTLFALMSLSTWATIGSVFSDNENEDIWTLFHRVTPYVVCTISLISIVLLCIDFF